MSASPRRGFTLVEMLVVVAIIAIAFSMIAFLPKRETKEAAVQAAAEELAATMRLTRAMAIAKRTCLGITFNIQNGAGTTGQLINNWSGQHWYRIVGPSYNSNQWNIPSENQPSFNFPFFPLANLNPWGDQNYTLKAFLDQVNTAWVGDRHVLKARSVRMIAISDQDNGACCNFGGGTNFKPTYPRPWCGYYDATSKRYYPWGGYDHALNPSSAFYLEGKDGQLTGCVNPADRFATDSTVPYKIFAAGKERPVINGEWLDYVLKFNPDGSVEEGLPGYIGNYGQVANTFLTRLAALGSSSANIGDMIMGPSWDWASTQSMMMRSFEPYTGFWSITLAPDIDRDCDPSWPTPTYPSVYAAIQAQTPMYRVQVSPLGKIRVVRVRLGPPEGSTLTMDATAWQAQPGTYYQGGLPTRANGSLRLDAHPENEFLLPNLPQQHWMTSP